MKTEVKIHNCNNIEEGIISIEENKLNLKYAFNGTGKSTVSKSIVAKIYNNQADLESLKPFKYRGQEEGIPEVEGLDRFHSIEIFNDEYVEQYVFQSDELIKGSFEIFIKTPDYDNHMSRIEGLIKNIHDTFNEDEELNKLIIDLEELIKSFGNAKGGYSASSALGKGLGKGNKLTNIPDEISQYSPFLRRNDINVPWLKWQKEGVKYQVDDEICPYCATGIAAKKEKIQKVSENFDSTIIKNLNSILSVFETFKLYFSEEANSKVKEISQNIAGISTEQKNYLKEIKDQAIALRQKLVNLRNLGFVSLDNADKVSDIIVKNKIDITYLSHFNSLVIQEKTNQINQSINKVLEKVGQLQGEVAQQRNLIRDTIRVHNTEINNFLLSAGYNYHVSIDSDNEKYKLKLYHNDYDEAIPGTETHLSYGERNAFALALFMYGTLHKNPDLIILDDPISSFDGNKKFAIINMLFMGSNSFKDKTVLLLTHEFGLVIDLIYNFKHKILPTPIAHFLSMNSGRLSEKEITKDDIKSFVKIAKDKFSSSIDIINKLIYLRRLLDLNAEKNLEWNLLSSLFHKKYPPTKRTENNEVVMTKSEIEEAENKIKEYIPDFNYEEQVLRINDTSLLKGLYHNCLSNYERLQIFRIVFDKVEFDNKIDDSVFKHYVNKTFHIENDYLFQLDPSDYDTVPQFIIDICDKTIQEDKHTSGYIKV